MLSNLPIEDSTIFVASLAYSLGNNLKSNCRNPWGNYSKTVNTPLPSLALLNSRAVTLSFLLIGSNRHERGLCSPLKSMSEGNSPVLPEKPGLGLSMGLSQVGA
jgi:hypothetical protein